jgi:cell division protein FtsB
MTKREKITLIIALALLAAVLFLIDNSSNNKRLIKESNAIIKELHKSNKVYTSKIATLEDSIRKLQQKDTVIITKYREKIKYIDTFTKPDYIMFFDTIIGTNIAQMDTFLCFDSTNIATITKKLLEGERDSILLNNCIGELQLCDSINSYKDSLIDNKDSEIEVLSDVNKEKIKKLRRQRNALAGVSFVEFLVILGLISK